MTATTRYAIDSGYTPVSFNAGDIYAMPDGGAALSSTVITNGSSLDMLMDVSFSASVGGTTTSTSRLSLYVLPLNQDGTTYGDGFASSAPVASIGSASLGASSLGGGSPPAPAQPSLSYMVRDCKVRAGVVPGGAVVGTFPKFDLPPGNFRLAIANNLGVPFPAPPALTLACRAYNFNLNA